MPRVIITGATGFIGKALCRRLAERGYEIIALSRNLTNGKEVLGKDVQVVEWDAKSSRGWLDYVEGAKALLNLAGESLASGRWTEKKKHSILQSRLDAGRAVVEAVRIAKKKPEVVVQSSAIGYYGPRHEEICDESFSPGQGFLSEVSQKWELSTQEVEAQKTRRVIIRTGIVLGKEGGAFPRLAKPFRFFVGGPLGSGKQWLSWIHLDDEVNAIIFLMERDDLSGVFNLTAPHPVLQKDFSRDLGKVMKHPSWLPVPAFVLRFLFGEMAKETLLSGQRVLPKRLLASGFRFLYPELESALKEIFKENKPTKPNSV
jgi:uncharacterized protein (TIGR01777 family)